MNNIAEDRPLAASADAYISAEEGHIRRDLAACYRLVAMFGWDDLVATHISARLPGADEAFLINPFGMLFEEVTASSLVKISTDGEILAPTPHKVNAAGFTIHSAVHMAREDAGCVIHLHTRDGVAVSMIEDGVLPLNQTAMLVAGDIAFHEYEGVAVDLDERERLQRDLGDNHLMLLRNHGTLALGASVAEAFTRMYFLEWACSVQVRALGMGRPLHDPDPTVITKMGQRSPERSRSFADNLVWPALLRKLDRIDPSYKD
ncbi:MAG: class aldolase [Phenylobacterium sp.]|nr:class aldolase [Phenylobacterium sp.]